MDLTLIVIQCLNGMQLGILLFLLVAAVVAAVSAWLVETPGSITLAWRDWRIDTSVAVLVLLVILLIVISAVIYQVWRLFRRAPKTVLGLRNVCQDVCARMFN